MTKVTILNVSVLDNPAPFFNPLQFEITFECLEELEDDLEFKIIYVGSAESSEHDQILDQIMVGPVPIGVNKFVFQAAAPNTSLLPPNDAVSVTVILLTCSYFSREFVRVGYYVNNEYADETLRETPPNPPQFDKVLRNILADQPRVTRFPIAWTRDQPDLELPPVDPNVDNEPVAFDLSMPQQFNDEDDLEMDEEEEEEEDQQDGGTAAAAANDLSPNNLDAISYAQNVMV